MPAAAGTVAALVLFLLHLAESDKSLQRWALALPILLVLISFLMVSTIRYPSFKQVDWQTKTRFRSFLLVLIVALLVWRLPEVSFLVLFLGYIFFGIARALRRTFAARAAKVPPNAV